MPSLLRNRLPRRFGMALLALVAIAALAGPAIAAHRTVKVGTARNATLHKTILVTARGRSLYALSAEVRGKFICTDSTCLMFWTPLGVPKGATPTGVKGLSVIKRPNGKRQVAFHGHPLYTFTQDHKRGDVGGEGFKDVGTWHAVKAPSGR